MAVGLIFFVSLSWCSPFGFLRFPGRGNWTAPAGQLGDCFFCGGYWVEGNQLGPLNCKKFFIPTARLYRTGLRKAIGRERSAKEFRCVSSYGKPIHEFRVFRDISPRSAMTTHINKFPGFWIKVCYPMMFVRVFWRRVRTIVATARTLRTIVRFRLHVIQVLGLRPFSRKQKAILSMPQVRSNRLLLRQPELGNMIK